MKPTFPHYLLATASLVLLAPAASAQESIAQLSPVIVTANRTPTAADKVASSVTVITAEEIKTRQLQTLPDVLNSVPGLQVVQAGGPGAQTSVFMRGANSNHTKVIIDGIEVNDPGSPSGAFTFTQIPVEDIARVEVLRGPQSGLYGSDAIGGVISIITKTGKGKPRVTASVEGGSHSTHRESAGISGSEGKINYAFNFSNFHSGDTKATPRNLVVAGNARNEDRFDNTAFSTKLGAHVTETLAIGIIGRYAETDADFTQDDFIGVEPFASNTQEQYVYTRAFADLSTFGGKLDHTFGVSYGESRRTTVDPSPLTFTPFAFFTGERTGADWQGKWYASESQTVVLGLEHENESVGGGVEANVSTNSGVVELQSQITDNLFNALSIRHDDHGTFGGETTWRIAPSYHIPETGTKLKATYGTGFKAPTLSQLFDTTFGSNNPNLEAEESKGFDLGFEQAVLGDKVTFGSTYFQNDIENLITFGPGFVLANINKAETRGFESFVRYQPINTLTLQADHTFTIAQDETTTFQLLRRPKHKASLTGTWNATDAATLSATALYIGEFTDGSRDFSVPRLKADDYVLLNLAASYKLGSGITAFGRVDNVLNDTYENPVGFEHPGIGFFLGLRAEFDAFSGK
ncbi:MAG: TonB-dependent receptor [Alphaproteobacteria bacterium]|nr:TonB-dependent receptor [Alphaproteobacteria bacterium]